ncbi:MULTISPECIES: GPR endopeptidase [Ureibacillus]|jgi:spore protease|uniref:GPR endopeptidase n=1 Tax=Ureibacillus TaxID=160795 RepID=UPI000BBB94A3|nr:GPR endopeptidase [Ureibacillus thermosphaericus]
MQEIIWNRTDLIDETEEVVQHQTKQQKEKLDDTEGVKFEEFYENRVKVTKVTVNQEGAKEIGKKEGQYFTLTVPTLNIDDHDGMKQLEKAFVKYIDEIHQNIKLTKKSKILVIGLGNKTITPDAIGPFTIDAMQSRQLEEHNEQFILYAPGVTGQTGFETSDFVLALAEKIQPDLVIAIDALATRGTARLCKTIQITNTGIHPGSGVGNQRAEISKEVLGIPVTAIGVPTVVDATVIIADAVDKVFRSIATKIQEKDKPSGKLSVTSWTSDSNSDVDLNVVRPIFGEWSTWSKAERRQLFEEVLLSGSQRLIVTPKEVDIWMTKYSVLISNGLFNWVEDRLN